MTTRSSIGNSAAATYRRLPKAMAALPLVLATALAASLWATAAQADPLIVGNNASTAAGGAPIQTYDFATGGAPVNSFVPDGATALGNDGRGVAVLANKVYYTELSGGVSGPTLSIEVAPFNGGGGGADIVGSPPPPPLPNPRPGTGIADLAIANGVLYALTGYLLSPPPQVFGLDPNTGLVVSGPVNISGPASTFSDGFTVLPNGNFLINSGDGSCTYNQYNPSTGMVISGTTITLTGFSRCTGVTTNGAHLFFSTDFDSFTETDLTGFVILTKSVTSTFTCDPRFVECVEDISLVSLGCAGVPATPNCHGKCVSSLAQQYGGIRQAASALGYSNVTALQRAIDGFCASP